MVLGLLLSCGRTQLLALQPDGGVVLGPQLPVAVVTPETADLRLNEVVVLNGSASYDPEGEPLTFEWLVVTRPAASAATFFGGVGLKTQLQPDAPGTWEVGLVVSTPDGRHSPRALSRLQVAGPLVDAGVPLDAGHALDAGTPPTLDAGSPPTLDAGTGAGTDLLDPNEVYLAGTLSEGACYRDALAPVLSPNTASAGFDCYFDERSGVVNPTTKRLLYTNTFEGVIREYHCDDCAVSPNAPYPQNVLANDTPRTAPCPSTMMGDLVTGFFVSPDGAVFHRCTYSYATWRDETGAAVFDSANDSVSAWGRGEVLVSDGLGLKRVVSLTDGTQLAVTGLPAGHQVLTTRWKEPNAFRVAVHSNGSDFLYELDVLTGHATKLGEYPASPNLRAYESARLDPAGRLYAFGGKSAPSFSDVVIRRSTDGENAIVYDEDTWPLVRIHISALVTGP